MVPCSETNTISTLSHERQRTTVPSPGMYTASSATMLAAPQLPHMPTAVVISVPHDEAPLRIEATLAAGGSVRSDAAAPAFWVLADPEGNEACVTTWQGRG